VKLNPMAYSMIGFTGRRERPIGKFGCGLVNWRVSGRSHSAGVPAGTRLCRQPAGSCSEKSVGPNSVPVDSVRETVTSREEVRPMNAVTMWVLPLVFTVQR
jgi:hypothetical protein